MYKLRKHIVEYLIIVYLSVEIWHITRFETFKIKAQDNFLNPPVTFKFTNIFYRWGQFDPSN